MDENSSIPPKRKRGGPTFIPTQNQRWLVQVLSSHGFSQEFLCRNLRDDNGRTITISVPTLRKAFKEDLAHGHEQVKAAMIASLVKQGLAGNVNAIKYWLSLRGGPEWRPIMPVGGGEDEGGTPIASAGTTIIIRGGLPQQITYEAGSPAVEGENPATPQGTLPLEEVAAADIKPNGKANGHAESDDHD